LEALAMPWFAQELLDLLPECQSSSKYLYGLVDGHNRSEKLLVPCSIFLLSLSLTRTASDFSSFSQLKSGWLFFSLS
jgi:hypothetical protein